MVSVSRKFQFNCVTDYPIFKLRDSGNLGIIEIGSTCLTVSISSVDDYQLIKVPLKRNFRM